MSIQRQLLSICLAGVMAIFTLLDVVAVKCYADSGLHQAIEIFGHQQGAVETCDDPRECSSASEHNHDHPIECTDEPILSDKISARAGFEMEQQQQIVAVILPVMPDLAALLTVDPTSEPHLCPRPPPYLPSAVDHFVTLRLTV